MPKKCACEKRAERRTLVTIKQPVFATSTTGQKTETGSPTTIGTAYVRAHKMHGTELFEVREVFPRAEWKFFGGYEDLGSVTPDMYVELDSKRYDILDVDDIDYLHRDVVLTATHYGA